MSRIKLTIPPHKIFETKIKVRITDINYGNHLGNDALISIIHEARMQWLQKGNFTELNIAGAGMIMADLAVEYKGESFFGDELIIAISVDDIQPVSFDIFYEVSIVASDKKKLIAKVKTNMVCFDYAIKKPVQMPDAFLDFLKTII